MRHAYGVACAGLALLLAGSAQAAERTAWQIKADIAVRKVFDDTTADKVRALFTALGKGTRARDISVEPDGDGVIAKIKIAWSGSVIALDYGVTIRWRFTAAAHLNSDAEGFIGIGFPTDKTKRDAEIAEATKLYVDDFAYIPLHQQALVWAARKNIDLVQPADNSFPLRFVTVK